MIIWKFKEHPEDRGDTWPCKAFRSVIEVTLDLKLRYFMFGLVKQHQWRSTGEWCDNHVGNWEICISDHWVWGGDHIYYDGPHCMFSLGFIHFHYPPRGGWCKKCMPDD